MSESDSSDSRLHGAFERKGKTRQKGSHALLAWMSALARGEPEKNPLESAPCQHTLPPKLGRFRLESILGQGGYGVVFRAFDTSEERPVALKIAWPHVMYDRVSSQRFVDEPKASASLDHSGIVRIYTSGWVGPICYIALELIDGPTLSAWCEAHGSVPPQHGAQIVKAVAEAIQYAHENDIIHRDLKPSNILLRPCNGGEGFGYEPVVTDLGLARRLRASALADATATQAVVGTDHYMSPEQALGQKVGPLSDVFSLGVVLYELVLGRRPFDGNTSLEVREHILHDDPPSMRASHRSVPKDLEAIILKCLEKSPGNRYESAQHFADDLGRFLAGEPVHAQRKTIWQNAWKYAKRKPRVVTMWLLAVATALLFAGMLGAFIDDRANASRQIASAERLAAVADGNERQHQYAANIQHAHEALRRGGRREVLELLDECRLLAHEPVQRGIEWDFLWAQTNDADRTLRGHDKSVHAVRFSPDGHLLISGGEDGRVIIWDASTWTKRYEINDKVDEVNAVEISADGSLLAVAGDDGRVVVHRIDDGSVIFDEPIVKGRAFVLAWLGDGTRLAVGGDDAVLSIVDPISHEHRRTAPLTASAYGIARDPTHPIEIKAFAFLPQQNALAVAMSPGGLHVFDVETLSEVGRLNGELIKSRAICSIPQSPGYLAATCYSLVQIWNLDDRSQVAEFPTDDEPRSLCYSSATGTLIAGLRNGEVQTWNVASALAGVSPIGRRFFAHSGLATAAEISPDGAWLATGGQETCIRLWHRRSLGDPFDVPLDDKPDSVEFSPCGRWVAVVERPVGQSLRITMCDAFSGKFLWTTGRRIADSASEAASVPIHSKVAFDATGSIVACLGEDRSIHEHDSQTGRVIKVYSLPTKNEVALHGFSPDGKSLVIADREHGTYFIDRSSGNIVDHIEDPARTLIGVLRTKLGPLWLESGASQRCLLRATPSATPSLVLPGLTTRIQVATVSQDGRYVAAVDTYGIIYAWDLEHMGPPSKFIGHVGHFGGVGKLCFSPDGQTILSFSRDGTVRFWHVPTRAELLKLGTPDEPIQSMGLNPAGNLLVLAIEREGRYGLQIHRLGPDRESLPSTLELTADEP